MPTGNEIGRFASESETLFLQSIELTAGDAGRQPQRQKERGRHFGDEQGMSKQRRDGKGRHGRECEVLDCLHRFCALLCFFVFVGYGERPGCRRNSHSVMPTFRCRVFRVRLLVWPTVAGSGNSRFQTTLHALRFSASFNQDLTADGDLLFTLGGPGKIAVRQGSF